MITVGEFYRRLSQRIPKELSCSWDHDGWQINPCADRPLKRILVALDPTDEMIQRAAAEHFDVLLTHHPILFRATHEISQGKIIQAAKAGLSVMSFHTRLDALSGGVNDELANRLHLSEVQSLGALCRIGKPHCSHMNVTQYADYVAEQLKCDAIRMVPSEKEVRCVAVCGGSGGDFAQEALMSGANVLITGEAGYHTMLDFAEKDLCIMEVGHYESEQPVCHVLQRIAAEEGGSDVSITIAESKKQCVRGYGNRSMQE